MDYNEVDLAAQTICDSFLPKGCAGIPPALNIQIDIDSSIGKPKVCSKINIYMTVFYDISPILVKINTTLIY